MLKCFRSCSKLTPQSSDVGDPAFCLLPHPLAAAKTLRAGRIPLTNAPATPRSRAQEHCMARAQNTPAFLHLAAEGMRAQA